MGKGLQGNEEASERRRQAAENREEAGEVAPSTNVIVREASATRTESVEWKDPESKLSSVQGIVLAGVHRWDASGLDHVLARPLVPIAGRPLITHTLNWFRQSGINRVSICANSETVFFRRSLGAGQGLGVGLDYYEDVMPRGPAGCARDVMVDTDAAVFVLVDGTIVPQINLTDLLVKHTVSNAALTVVAAWSGRSCETCLEPIGIYICSRRVLAYIPETGYQDTKEVLIPRLRAEGEPVVTHVVPDTSAPRVMGSASYLAVSKWVLEQMARRGVCPDGYVRCGEAWVHESARVAPSARLIGPVLVEPGCKIESRAVIVGASTIGAGCTVAHDAVVSRSTLWEGCCVGPRATFDHCVLTDHVTIDADAKVRNTVCIPPRRWKRRSRSERLGLRWWSACEETDKLKGGRGCHSNRVTASDVRSTNAADYQPVVNSTTVGSKVRLMPMSIERKTDERRAGTAVIHP